MKKHKCNDYYCDRPECIKVQRDKLRNIIEKQADYAIGILQANCREGVLIREMTEFLTEVFESMNRQKHERQSKNVKSR